MNILINPKSQSKLAALTRSLPHAVLLTGLPGVGLGTIADHIAAKSRAGRIEPIDSKGQVSHESGTITIEIIRRLYDQTRARQTKPQVFIIDSAERMSLGAQAAFLKLLEEPNDNTHFILTSHSPQALLPTIRSRVQAVAIDPITDTQTDEFIKNLGITDPKKQTQLRYLAAGLPAELIRLASDEAYFRARAGIVADTRTFLVGSAYQKLLVVSEYQKDRTKTLQLLDCALSITKKSFTDKPQTTLAMQLDTLLKAREKVESNCSARLQLIDFVIQ